MAAKTKKILTLCMIRDDSRVLLGMKKIGFGAGRWNGFGGKAEEGESVEDAARREVREETGVEVNSMERVGILTFEFQDDPKALEVHVFDVSDFSGEPIETEEMRPQWFDFDRIPFGEMWPDDRYWMPILLAGDKFIGRFLFDRPSTSDYASKIVEKELKTVAGLESHH